MEITTVSKDYRWFSVCSVVSKAYTDWSKIQEVVEEDVHVRMYSGNALNYAAVTVMDSCYCE